MTSTLDSAQNALRLLKMLGRRGSITIAEASAQLLVGKSTAHRLLMTLLAAGYATRDLDGHRYYPGQAAVAAGLATLWEFDVRSRAAAPLRRLAEVTGETAKLLVLDGPFARVLDVAQTPGSLRLGESLGRLLPANATAAGKLLLSTHDEASLRDRFGGRLAKLTDRTIDDWDFLAVELQRIRDRGWATSDGESTPHVQGIAVPVYGGDWMIGAVAIAVPEIRCTRPRRLELVDRLFATATAIGQIMGSASLREAEGTRSPDARRAAG